MAHELDERLHKVEIGQATTNQLISDHITVVDTLLTKHDNTIYGTDNSPGLTVRLDREEQKSKNITRVIWIVLTGAIGMGMTYAATSLF